MNNEEDVIMVLHKSKLTPLFAAPPIDIDEENCNYLNYIALFILIGIFFLLFLIFTSHTHFLVCYHFGMYI